MLSYLPADRLSCLHALVSRLPALTSAHAFVYPGPARLGPAFLAGLIYLTGGVESLFSFLLSAGHHQRQCLSAPAGGSVGGLGRGHSLRQPARSSVFWISAAVRGSGFPEQISGREVFYAVFVNVVAFFLTAFSAAPDRRLRSSEAALERKEIDYDELENLNQSILANIISGLMIVMPRGGSVL